MLAALKFCFATLVLVLNTLALCALMVPFALIKLLLPFTPVRRLTELLGWKSDREPGFGILMQLAEKTFILAVDTFVGREDVVIKSLQNVSLKGVAGATLSGDGAVVLVLDMDSLLNADKTHAAVHGAMTPLPA